MIFFPLPPPTCNVSTYRGGGRGAGKDSGRVHQRVETTSLRACRMHLANGVWRADVPPPKTCMRWNPILCVRRRTWIVILCTKMRRRQHDFGIAWRPGTRVQRSSIVNFSLASINSHVSSMPNIPYIFGVAPTPPPHDDGRFGGSIPPKHNTMPPTCSVANSKGNRLTGAREPVSRWPVATGDTPTNRHGGCVVR